MPTTQIADIIVPAQFTAYQVENSLVSTALFQSGVVAKNGLIADQLAAGATNFTVPFWADLGDTEADITSDDPTVLSTPQKIGAGKQTVRKSFLHASWSEMSLASELAGSSALQRVQRSCLCILGPADGEALDCIASWNPCKQRNEQRKRHGERHLGRVWHGG